MKPLVSPVLEYRLLGIGDVLAGIAIAAVALLVQDLARVVLSLAIGAAVFGVGMYFMGYRGSARRAIERPSPVPTPNREPLAHTLRRVVLIIAPPFALALIAGVLTDLLGGAAGILLGTGAATLLVSQSLRRWEKKNRRRLLREPRYRWSGPGPRGWTRGRGIIDPQDFYAEPSSESGTASPGKLRP